MSDDIKIFGIVNFKNTGQRLNQMANRFDTEASLIQQANDIADANKVNKGTTYIIPKELEELDDWNELIYDAKNSSINENEIIYIAIEKHKPDKGQGLDSFCKKYGITREQFYELNPDYDSSNPSYINANTEYNTMSFLSKDEVKEQFGVNADTSSYKPSDTILQAAGETTTNTSDAGKDLRFGYLEDNFERGEYIIEAGKYIPDYAKNVADTILKNMGQREKQKNLNSAYDNAYNWTLSEFGNIDPNYNPRFDRGDVFVTCTVQADTSLRDFAYATGYNEEDIASINGLTDANQIRAYKQYTFEINPNDIYTFTNSSEIQSSNILIETVDTRKIPEGEMCKISDYIAANEIDEDRFYFYNKHLEGKEYLTENQIVVVPIEHPAFCPDTYADSNGNEYQIEIPNFVSEKDRRLYEAQLAPLAFGNNGIVPTQLFKSQEEFEQALYRGDYNSEIKETMEKYKDTGIYDSYQEINFQILMYYSNLDNRKKAGENIPYITRISNALGSRAIEYEFHANGATIDYSKQELYKLIGFDDSSYNLFSSWDYTVKDVSQTYDKNGNKIKRDNQTIYEDTLIKFNNSTLNRNHRYF